MKTQGIITLNETDLDIIRFIVAKRMSDYYYEMTKKERVKYFSKMDITDIYKELNKLMKLDTTNGPKDKFFKSWTHSYNSNTQEHIISQNETKLKISQLFSLEVDVADGGGASFVSGNDIDEVSTELVVKYSDIRESKWITINDNTKMTQFIESHKLNDITKILEFVFPDKNVLDIIIDISGILLDNYKDRTKAYEIVLNKFFKKR